MHKQFNPHLLATETFCAHFLKAEFEGCDKIALQQKACLLQINHLCVSNSSVQFPFQGRHTPVPKSSKESSFVSGKSHLGYAASTKG